MSAIDGIVGERLRARREMMGWSAAEFAEKLGIDPSELAAIEDGSERLGPSLMAVVCQALDVQPQYFFTSADGEASNGFLDCEKDKGSDGSCLNTPIKRH